MLRSLLLVLFICFIRNTIAQVPSTQLQVSGVYPHLAVFNGGGGLFCKNDGEEGGIGAVVPWARKLWVITCSPHCLGGSSDKLHGLDSGLNLSFYEEGIVPRFSPVAIHNCSLVGFLAAVGFMHLDS